MNTARIFPVALALFIPPAAAYGQYEVRLASVAPILAANTCSVARPDPGHLWDTVMESLTRDPDVAKSMLETLQDSVAGAAAARPEDLETQYLLATVLGARAEVEGGRGKVRAAQALLTQLDVVLALEPDHAGALHMKGRLHAAVMRMDWMTRFIATRLLGGAKLAGASWSEAEHLLERARTLEPCASDHHYQLARVYADQGKRSLAVARLRELLELGPDAALDHRVWGSALALVDELAGSR